MFATPTETYTYVHTLTLHDALPIFLHAGLGADGPALAGLGAVAHALRRQVVQRPVEVVAEGGPQVARIGGLRSRPQLVPLGQVDRQPLRERHAGALRVGLALSFGDVRVDALLHFADADPRKLASLAGGDVVSLADQDARHRSDRPALEKKPGRRRWTHTQTQLPPPPLLDTTPAQVAAARE